MQWSATSRPPPSAKPLTNAKVGFLLSPNLRKTSCPSFPIASACFGSLKKAMPDKSAPAAKIKGFPVIAIATEELASAIVIASLSAAKELGPKVFGRLWSKPLSKVISERVPV